MRRQFARRYCVLTVLLAVTASVAIPSRPTRAAIASGPQVRGERLGRILRTYRGASAERTGKQADQAPRPKWAETAFRDAMDHFRAAPGQEGLEDPDHELTLAAADEDDLGQTHLRLQQVHDGVEVVGGELIVDVDGGAVQDVSGRIFAEARVDTTSELTAPQAVEVVRASPDVTGAIADEPTATLVILPNLLFKGDGAVGATLAYRVDVDADGGANGAAHDVVFVDADSGEIVWHYDDLEPVKFAGAPGAVEASFADIFGTAVELDGNIDPESLALEDAAVPRAGIARTIANPKSVTRAFGIGDTAEVVTYPDHYADYWRDPYNRDNGGVHVNSSIMSHAFYLLAVGGTHRLGVAVPGIGRSKAEKIFRLARATRLTKAATFPDVCKATVLSAGALYGHDSPEFGAAIAAWNAVGVFTMTSAPASVSWSSNRVDVFARGLDNACWHKVWDGTQWHAWESLGGVLVGAPAVTSRGYNQLDLFVRGTDNQLYMKVWDGWTSSSWSAWTPLGKPSAVDLYGNPYWIDLDMGPAAVASSSSKVSVFGSTGELLWVLELNNGVPTGAGWTTFAGPTYRTPGVSSTRSGEIFIAEYFYPFVEDRFFNGSGWTEWGERGGTTYSGLAAVSTGFASTDTFVRGTDNAVWGYSLRNGVFSGWYTIGGVTYDAPSASTRGGGMIDVFVRGTDDTLYQAVGYGSNGPWYGWYSIP